MSTNIVVDVALAALRQLNQAQVNANRQAKLLADRNAKLAQKAVDAEAVAKAQQGQARGGALLYGVRQGRKRLQPQPVAAVYRQAGAGQFDVGFWLYGVVNSEVVNSFYTGNFGVMFKPSRDLRIRYLGCYDGPPDGMQKDMTVQLWQDGVATPLASVIVPAGADSHKAGTYRYADIEQSVPVNSETYYAVACFYESTEIESRQQDRYQYYAVGQNADDLVVAFNTDIMSEAFLTETSGGVNDPPFDGGSRGLVAVNVSFALEGAFREITTPPHWVP